MNTDSDNTPAKPRNERSQRYHDDALRHKAHINVLVFGITLLAAVAYLVWAFRSVDYGTWYVGGAYLFAEVLCFISLLIWSGMMIRRREHASSGLPMPDPPPAVDVIVTCCGEPLRVIEKTLRAVADIDYPDFKVTVADDRADAAVGALCKELGFEHLCRDQHTDNKAGNLNFALEQTMKPLILTLDADQIPHPSILKVLVGYFSVPYIGFVTTYQGFYVPKGDPWGNRDRVFYGAMQPARNDSNSAISCGSGVVYRREALAGIGGFSTWNLVEDLYSSLLMHASGWKSVYHPFPLTHGTAPLVITSHAKQRWQWAVDSMRLFFWRNPLFTKGLTWHQKLNYFGFGYNYVIFGLAYPVFFLIPVWGLFSGRFFMTTSVTEFILWRTPYAVAYLILNAFLTDHRHTTKTFRAQTGLFLVYISAILTALFSPGQVPKYTVSQKLVDHPGLFIRLRHVTGHLILMLLCIAGIVFAWQNEEMSRPHYWVNAAWAVWVVWLLMPYVRLSLRPPPTHDFR